MLNTQHSNDILAQFAEHLRHSYNPFDLKTEGINIDQYKQDDFGHFIDNLIQQGHFILLNIIKNSVLSSDFDFLLQKLESPILVFRQTSTTLEPIIIYKNARNQVEGKNISTTQSLNAHAIASLIIDLKHYEDEPDQHLNGQIVFLTAFPMPIISEEKHLHDEYKNDPPTPLKRLFLMLRGEGKDIVYIYIYALVVGIFSLTLPLGIQAIIGFIASGSVFSSVGVLISLVIAAVLVIGGLQIMQLRLVEVLQQRVFAKAAFDFIFRLPRIKAEALQKLYAPELMNRFFDILTIQKALPKVLVDITGSVVQVMFGLLLLAFYHPFFLAFAFVTLGVVGTILYFMGPKGLDASMRESKYKYKIAHWLQEIARTVESFRLASTSHLYMEKMDEYVNHYLYYRRKHFKVLVGHFLSITLFKTVITGGLLILGTILVVSKQISLGQFVASEVVIILVVNSVEKLMISMDTIYDLLTALDKVGHITDLPLDKNFGIKANISHNPSGVEIFFKNVNYYYEKANNKPALKNINVHIKAGERICLAGANGAGKQTLIKILLGTIKQFEGNVTVAGFSLRDLNVYSLRAVVEDNFSEDEIFAGTILENITMGKSQISYQDIMWAIENVGLSDYINALPDGLYTELTPGGRTLNSSQRHKLILARCIASKPKLLIVNDYFHYLPKPEKYRIIQFLQKPENPWTLIAISNDLIFLSSSERILFMKDATINTDGTYDQLMSNEDFRNIISEQNVMLDVLKSITAKRSER